MITSYDELITALDTLDLGSNVLRLEFSATAIQLEPPVCPSKTDMVQSGYWLDGNIAAYIRRRFDPDLRRWVLKPEVLGNVKKAIVQDLITTIGLASDAVMPERTTLYKEYRQLNDKYGKDRDYLTSVIQILNYYHGAKTDPTCKSNVIGLLNILRKRYNGKSSSTASGASTGIPF